MDSLALFGAVVSFVNLLMTLLTGLLFARSRKLASDSSRLRSIEPKYLAAQDWHYRVQVWAAARGLLEQLPPPKAGTFEDVHIPSAEEQARFAEFEKWKGQVEQGGQPGKP